MMPPTALARLFTLERIWYGARGPRGQVKHHEITHLETFNKSGLEARLHDDGCRVNVEISVDKRGGRSESHFVRSALVIIAPQFHKLRPIKSKLKKPVSASDSRSGSGSCDSSTRPRCFYSRLIDSLAKPVSSS